MYNILLIQQQVQGDAVGTAVFYIHSLQHGCTGGQHRDGTLGDTTPDDGFSEGTSAAFTQWDQ